MARLLLPAVLLLVGLAACGGDDGGLDRSRYRTVYDAALQAVHDRDLKALWPLLTENGKDKVQRDLRAWQAQMRDEEKGARILALALESLGSLDPAEVERAKTGRIEDAWAFLLRADPRPARPPTKGLRAAKDGRHVELDYQDPRGALRTVRLVQRADGWYVDELEL